jgi:GR25 family glycosyltransferase involved in LPS biosynthesis
MDCIYINLDEQAARRQSLESNFHQVCPDWHINRVPAVSATQIECEGIPGKLRNNEKACFLSHVKALEFALTLPDHVLIAEDDILFGETSAALIERAIATLSADWDIVFTDVCITGVHAMIELFQLRRMLTAQNGFRLVNLKGVSFAAATSYVVNTKSKLKIRDLLLTHRPLDTPLDLFIRQLVNEESLNACVLFPFATSLSDHADASQVQVGDGRLTDLVWNSFRRAMWIQRDLDRVELTLKAIQPRIYEKGSAVLSKIVGALLSGNLTPK